MKTAVARAWLDSEHFSSIRVDASCNSPAHDSMPSCRPQPYSLLYRWGVEFGHTKRYFVSIDLGRQQSAESWLMAAAELL